MKESKVSIAILLVLLAIPIPFSLISWIGTIVSVASIGMVNWSKTSELVQGVAALTTMLLAGTYLGTYIFSLIATLKKKAISLMSLLPVLHIVIFGISVTVWMWLNSIYRG